MNKHPSLSKTSFKRNTISTTSLNTHTRFKRHKQTRLKRVPHIKNNHTSPSSLFASHLDSNSHNIPFIQSSTALYPIKHVVPSQQLHYSTAFHSTHPVLLKMSWKDWMTRKSDMETASEEKLIATDEKGHMYFEYRHSWQVVGSPSHRRVQYANDIMAPDDLHELWEAWLRHQRTTAPSEQEFQRYNLKRQQYLENVRRIQESDDKLRQQEQLQKKLASFNQQLNKNHGEGSNDAQKNSDSQGIPVQTGRSTVMEIIAKMEQQLAEQRKAKEQGSTTPPLDADYELNLTPSHHTSPQLSSSLSSSSPQPLPPISKADQRILNHDSNKI